MATPSDRELARGVYRLLHQRPRQRDELSRELGVEDRQARDAVALASELAARHGVIIGMDPEDSRYYLVDLRSATKADVSRARRMILYLRSYFESTFGRYSRLAETYQRLTGQPLDISSQPTLVQAAEDPSALLRNLCLAAMASRGHSRELRDAVERAAAWLGIECQPF